MVITFNVTIQERRRPDVVNALTRGVDAVSDESRNNSIINSNAALAEDKSEDSGGTDSVTTNLSVSPITVLLSNQYIATIDPGTDGEIPGNDIGLNFGFNNGLVDLSLSRTATQDIGVNLGLPSSMSTSSDFDA